MKVSQSCLTLCDPAAHTVHGILQARILEWVAFPFSRDIPNPGIEPKSPTLQVDSLPAEPQGKPQNTGVGSQSLLQGIFPTQKSNWGLLHCRLILYKLSYQGAQDNFSQNSFSLFFLRLLCTACGILVPCVEIKFGPLAVKARNPNHWTTTEFPTMASLMSRMPFLILFLRGLPNLSAYRYHPKI